MNNFEFKIKFMKLIIYTGTFERLYISDVDNFSDLKITLFQLFIIYIWWKKYFDSITELLYCMDN